MIFQQPILMKYALFDIFEKEENLKLSSAANYGAFRVNFLYLVQPI